MNTRIAVLPLVLACTFLFPQSRADHNNLPVSSINDVQAGMPMKGVSQALQKHGFSFSVNEGPGVLVVLKDGELLAVIQGSKEDENTVGSITYHYSPLDWAAAFHNAVEAAGAVTTAPIATQHITAGTLAVTTIDQADSDGGQSQFVELPVPKSGGMYRMIIRRTNHAEPTVQFEFVR